MKYLKINFQSIEKECRYIPMSSIACIRTDSEGCPYRVDLVNHDSFIDFKNIEMVGERFVELAIVDALAKEG